MISIVIVNWNKAELTRICLENISRKTTGIKYEIIVVDNGSGIEEIEALRKHCSEYDARLIELSQNLYFGEANNIGAEAAHGEILLLLNNDVVVPDGYLQPLLNVLNSAYKAGAVGPKFVYPNGELQEAGAYIRADGWTIQHGKTSGPAELIASCGPHIVDYCSAACLLIRRETFLAAGGFDPLFDPAYFEDVDLMLKLRSKGLLTYLCADVTVVHHENMTSRKVWDQKRFEGVIAENHKKFMGRWGDYIGRRLFVDVEIPTFDEISWTPTPEPPPNLPRVVIEGHGIVRQTQEWSEIVVLASRLSSDYHVVFAADEACSRCRIFTLGSRAGVRLGSFAIRRRSDVEARLNNSVISARSVKSTAVLAVAEPHLERVRDALESLGWWNEIVET
jgi:GT2 family glycosyltransferase